MRKMVLTMVVAAIAVMGATASAASAAPATTCENSGTIKLSPGLSTTPQVQNVTVKGVLSNCVSSESSVTGGKYVGHLKTTEAIDCSALTGAGAADEGTIVLKLTPKEGANSKGTFSMPIAEGTTALGGLIEEGEGIAFSGEAISGSATQAYTGGATCGVAEGKKKAKKVNKGSFTGSLTIS